MIVPNIEFSSGTKDEVMFARILYLYNELNNIIDKHKITHCKYEDVPVNSQSNADVGKWLCIIQGVCLCICFQKGIIHENKHPTEWRKELGLLQTEYTCRECGKSFVSVSNLQNVICECGNSKKTKFSRKPLNTRDELKRRAVELANKLYGLDLKYISKTSKKNEDDIAEAIIIGIKSTEGEVK